MKYVVVKIGQLEVPMLFGNEVDLDQVKLPWPIVAAGVAIGQTIFFTCQSTQTINGQVFVSRGRKDEVLIQAADYLSAPQPETAQQSMDKVVRMFGDDLISETKAALKKD